MMTGLVRPAVFDNQAGSGTDQAANLAMAFRALNQRRFGHGLSPFKP